MRLSNYTPGFVESYDDALRLCRVRIPGITDGCEVLPLAMLSYPIGDKSEHTEIRILAGDRVWLDFVNGDPRYPIITGFRPKETDNAIAWRRWHHDNIELQADTDMRLLATAGKVTMTAGTDFDLTTGANIDAIAGGNINATADGNVVIEAASITLRAGAITLDGPVTATSTFSVAGLLTYLAGMLGFGTLFNNGKNVGHTHSHSGVQDGPNNSGPVN